jgi:hypothetical protein
MEKDEITPEYVINYAKRMGIENPEIEQIKSIFETMKKYGKNHWWEEKDPAISSFYQLFEDILVLGDMEVYEAGLKKLLERAIVWPTELLTNKESLQKEALEAKTLYSLGINHSEDHGKEKLKEGIKGLEKIAGDRLIKFNLDSLNLPDRDENGIDNSGYDGWLK